MFKYPNNNWLPFFNEETNNDYFKDLKRFVEAAYNEDECFPPLDYVFNAFNLCDLPDTKVVIIGQDPYHGLGQANGLCFSVNDGIKFPPSLVNIFKELETDLGLPIPISGNLERWATQGVFLLNATLTVKASEAGSHQKQGWETFTDAVIKHISNSQEHVIFMLWGGFAKKKAKLIDKKKHSVLETGHPSPLSANRGYWFGCKHFSKVNEILKSSGKPQIDW